MNKDSFYFLEHNVIAQVSVFCPDNKTSEMFVMLHTKPTEGEMFAAQYEKICKAKEEFLRTNGEGYKVVFERYFLSDIANQSPMIAATSHSCSQIQQQPLDGSKIALLVYMQRGTDVQQEGQMTVVRSNGYTHLWTANMQSEDGDSYLQTHKLLFDYEDMLSRYGATLADNCLRTWFFVRDVDSNYAGIVKGRREHFEHIGLTPETHYLASTGIDGSPAKSQAKVQLEAISAIGLKPEQIKYLHALTHLNPTYEYGVTFERGTRVEYGDRAHLWISGTASINNKGEIVHPGDVMQQTQRMWENVEALLLEGNASYDDVAYMIVYLRDIADYNSVKRLYDNRFPKTPKVFVHAPVCRPGWLIEMECVAITTANNPKYAAF